MNLLVETINGLKDCGRNVEDVKWVGSRDGEYSITWEEFASIANFAYDGGYGGQKIATDLVVVGDAWWLERHEYDGSEWWEHKELPKALPSAKKFSQVKNDRCWVSIKEINDPEV